MDDVVSIVTAVVTFSSAISAVIPEPKTRLGKRLKRFVDFFACNFGNATNRGVK